MRVLSVSSFSARRAVGGAEIVAHRHAQKLLRRGHDIAIFAGRIPKSSQTGGELELERHDDLDIYTLSIRSLDPTLAFRWDAAGRRLRSVLHHLRPDVVHFHNVMGLGANLILEAVEFGARTICTVHDHWGFCAVNTLLLPGNVLCGDWDSCHMCVTSLQDDHGKALPVRLRTDYVAHCLNQVDEMVFPSEYLKSAYAKAGFPAHKLHFVGNGIDLERFEQMPERKPSDKLRFTFIGYLGEHKGLHVLSDAIARLDDDPALRGRWELRIAGDGHLRSFADSMQKRDGLGGEVCYLGKLPSDEIAALLAVTDVLVMPSVWPENEPVVQLEAIAAGIAQIASNIGGQAALVDDGHSGFLFPSGSADDLAACMRLYIKDPSLAIQHGRYNRDRRERFSEDLAVDAYEGFYAGKSQPLSHSAAHDEILIICGGDWPTLPAAHLFNEFAAFENAKIRFIYEGWATPRMWEQAMAVFWWSDRVRDDVLLRIMKTGKLLIAPADSSAIRFMNGEQVRAFGYRRPADVVALLSLIDRYAPSTTTGGRTMALTELLAASVSSDSFALHAQSPAV